MTHSHRRRSFRRIRRNVDRRGRRRSQDTSAKCVRAWVDLKQRLDEAAQGPRRPLKPEV